MMSGAECSTSSTPLASLLKQQQTDHSLHQSNFSQPGSSAGSLRTHTPTGGALQHEDADRFFQQQQMGGGPGGSGQFANMDSIRRELEGVSRGSPQSALKGDRGEYRADEQGARCPALRLTQPFAGGALFLTEWASQYSPAGTSMNPADMARMEEQFRMQQQHPNDMTGARLLRLVRSVSMRC